MYLPLFLLICLYGTCFGEDEDHRTLLDLTHTLNMTHALFNGSIQSPDYSLDTDTDMGTHLIPPCYYNHSKWCIPSIPLSNLFVPAVVIDARGWVWSNSSARITLEQLVIWENQNGKITNGTVVLLLTGWGRLWNDSKHYKGIEGNDTSKYIFPDLEDRAASWLVNNRSVIGVGIDTLSLERGHNGTVHTILANANAYALENLCNLEYLDPFGNHLVVMPLKLDRIKLAPCRIVALALPNTTYFHQGPTTTTTTTTTTVAPTTTSTPKPISTSTVTSTTKANKGANDGTTNSDASHYKKKDAGKGNVAKSVSSFALIIISILLSCFVYFDRVL